LDLEQSSPVRGGCPAVKIVDDVLLLKVAVTRAAGRSNSSSLIVGLIEGRPRGEQRLGGSKGVPDGQQVAKNCVA